MDVHLVGIVLVLLAFGAVIAAAAYVFAMTAEGEPEKTRRPNQDLVSSLTGPRRTPR